MTMDMNLEKVVDFVDTGIRARQHDQLRQLDDPANRPQAPVGQAARRTELPDRQRRDITWQGWHFRLDYSMREGLILHQIGYAQNGGAVRPIIYRLAMSRSTSRTRYPDPNWAWRSAFDIGEYNLGQYAEPLAKNVDVPENAVFFDEVVRQRHGQLDGAFDLPHAAAIYERDAGSLWDRTDPTSFDRDARLARDLVVTAAYVIGNYTYATEYEFRIRTAPSTRPRRRHRHHAEPGRELERADGNKYGTTVADGIGAPSHQHFFSFRIDFDVDGSANRVVEENTDPVGSSLGQRVRDAGHRPRDGAVARCQPDDQPDLDRREHDEDERPRRPDRVRDRVRATPPCRTPTRAYPPLLHAPFAQHPFWVTRYKDGAELYAGGDYPDQGAPGEGLDGYTDSENTHGNDVVVWTTARGDPSPDRRGVPGHDVRDDRSVAAAEWLLLTEPGT